MSSLVFPDPSTLLDKRLMPLGEQREEKLESTISTLEGTSEHIMDARFQANLPMSEEDFEKAAKTKLGAWVGRAWPDGIPEDPDGKILAQMERKHKVFDIQIRDHWRNISTTQRRSTRIAMENNAALFPSDTFLEEDQIAAAQAGESYGMTDQQNWSKLVRTKGVVSDENFNVLYQAYLKGDLSKLARSPELAKNAGISEETRKIIEETVDRRFYGLPDTEDERIYPGWMTAIAEFAPVKHIVAPIIGELERPPEMMAAGSAGYLQQFRDSGSITKIHGIPGPTVEEIERIDGRENPMARLPYSTADVNPRKAGLTEEQREGVDIDVIKIGSSMWEGLKKSAKKPILEDELTRVRDAYLLAANTNLLRMKKEDPRYTRYYGETEDERMQEAIKIATENLGDDVEPEALERASIAAYVTLPQTKMLSDMLALDDWGKAIGNPDLASLVHKVVADPLWFINVFGIGLKAAVGTANIGSKTLKGLAPLTHARVAEKATKAKVGVSEIVRHWVHSDEHIIAAGKRAKEMSPEARAAASEKVTVGMDDMQEALEGIHKVANDAGGGSAQKIAKVGEQVLFHLHRIKGKEREVAWEILEGNLSIPDAVAQGLISKKLEKRLPIIRDLLDDFYGVMKREKQLSRVVKGKVEHASYRMNYIFRRLADPTDLHNRVVGHGYEDIFAAANAAFPKGASKLTELVKKMGYTGIDDAYRALTGTKSTRAVDILDEPVFRLDDAQRAALTDIGSARATLGDETVGNLHSFVKAVDDLDATGQNMLHRASSVTPSAFERTKMGDLYPWMKDPYKQAQMGIQQAVSKARVTGEMKAMGEAFGINNVGGLLSKDGMVKISTTGFKNKGANKVDDIIAVEKGLSEQYGIEMVALSGSTGKKVAATLLGEGEIFTNKGLIFVPKTMAKRVEALLPVAGSINSNEVAGGVRWFRDMLLRPANAGFRYTRTILRSLAFQPVNFFGAAGLGVIAHGLRAFNPRLQVASLRGAKLAAFGGNGKALAMKIPLPDGNSVNFGEIMRMTEDFGVIHQGATKYAFDIAGGKGVGGWVVQQYSKLARSTRMQQVAEFSDDYQKFVAVTGWVMRHGVAKNGRLTLKSRHGAANFAAEYAGNYNRLSKTEKGWGRDLFTFYSWNRFILPHLVRQMFKNPRRLAAFEKIQETINYRMKHNAPGATGLGVPPHIWQQRGFIAPKMMQPDEGVAGSNEYAMAVAELPLTSLSVLSGGFYGESPVSANLGPFGWAIIAMLTGGDEMGQRSWQKPFVLPTLDTFKNGESIKNYLFRMDESQGGRFFLQSVPLGIPSPHRLLPTPVASAEAWLNLAKLYTEHGMGNEAAELWLAERVGRDFLGLDRTLLSAFGMKGKSKALMLNVGGIEVPTFGVLRGYAVTPEKTAARTQRTTVGGLPKGD